MNKTTSKTFGLFQFRTLHSVGAPIRAVAYHGGYFTRVFCLVRRGGHIVLASNDIYPAALTDVANARCSIAAGGGWHCYPDGVCELEKFIKSYDAHPAWRRVEVEILPPNHNQTLKNSWDGKVL